MAQALNILIVEDSPPDVMLLERALDAEGRPHQVTVAVDGVDALALLRRDLTGTRRPDLILLDLNMPRMDGREFLEHVKHDPGLRSIPVVVLSTSDQQDDIQASYERHCNAYVTKPHALADFDALVQALVRFWADCVRRP